LYVVESNARHISAIALAADGTLGDREIFGPGDLTGTPDGFAFDEYGKSLDYHRADRPADLR